VSGVSAVQRSEAQAAIARASAATGVGFNFLLAQAKLESGLNPAARAGNSSAAGLYQFIDNTWLDTLDRHAGEHGLDWANQAITRNGGRAGVADPTARAEIMALRYDPDVSALMAAELARDNSAELSAFLGREPDPSELYLAHFLGAAGARSFLGALQDTPQATASALFPNPARSNQAIFYDGSRPRSVSEVMDVLRSRVTDAMNSTDSEPSSIAVYAAPMPSRAFVQAARTFAPPSGAPQRLSMAETLQTTFGGAGGIGSRAAQRISDAYGKFKAFDL
jgi:hypothetical protein